MPASPWREVHKHMQLDDTKFYAFADNEQTISITSESESESSRRIAPLSG